MPIFMWILVSIMYIGGVAAHVNLATTGYKCSRRATTKDLYIGLIWPVMLFLWFLDNFMFTAYTILSFVPLLVGIDYRASHRHRIIDNWFSRRW